MNPNPTFELAHISNAESTGLNFNDNTPNLRSLLLAIPHTPTHSPVPWIRAVLRPSGSRPSSIETITLRLEIDVPEDEQLLLRFLAPWRSIDALLSDLSNFPLLQSVSLELLKRSAVSLDLIRDQFPSLTANGRIQVTKEWEIRPSATTWR